MVNFDPAVVPFSRFGSYLALSSLAEDSAKPAGLYLRTVHGGVPRSEICKLELLHGGEVLVTHVHATPSALRMESSAGHVEIIFSDTKTLRLRSVGVVLRLTFASGEYDHAVRHPQGWEINSFSNRIRLAFLAVHGELQVTAPMRDGRAQELRVDCPLNPSGRTDIIISEFQSSWPVIVPELDFYAVHAASMAQFEFWLEKTPAVPLAYASERELAAYVQWSGFVAAEGNFTAPALLMSKNWLTQVWSWDHCFNAMALSYHHPMLAWDQFMLPFTRQHADGALPDCISDAGITWNFTKPPIHGWALLWMLRRTQWIGEEQLQAIYQPLMLWTNWWLSQRDDNENGIAQYNHGNDSGWDNSTVFDGMAPLETPDLSAFLILQMEALAEIAQRLQQPHAASAWAQRAEQLLKKMLTYFWRDDGFVAIQADGSDYKTQSLLLLMPLLLGKRLPATVRDRLVARLRHDDFFTHFGLASESTASVAYCSDGYWRGPIWAPPVLMLVSALADLGELPLAHKISQRFCNTVAQSGMAENFEALTGSGLRDGAHSWTASVFLILAHEYF